MQLSGAVVQRQNVICSVENSAGAGRWTPTWLTPCMSVADVHNKSMDTPIADVSSRPTHPGLLDKFPQIATAAVERYFAVLRVATPDSGLGFTVWFGLWSLDGEKDTSHKSVDFSPAPTSCCDQASLTEVNITTRVALLGHASHTVRRQQHRG